MIAIPSIFGSTAAGWVATLSFFLGLFVLAFALAIPAIPVFWVWDWVATNLFRSF